ncbi:AvaI/BsoBI family type II restriction endonuclease [Planktothrix agardhii]|jgi:hypothetical protein|nr:AvaI/BsoBI family type II restriction endonuclease [Planktothrix agardhii]MCF3605977.1 type II restriction endonuclease [Planktothrix agardhii 1033]CAD5909713.1 Type-2 restriction enzyme AvaI [Planktothrix rubescens]BBD55762.1 hypothetical protein NIES204_30790 [Planktothrix agardhii NIES-204]MCB8750033.1 type II restriction endonuclease [Planktothrix agardhii 1810]MCB8758785.1 type II restriction endonuclease [Planktothrix agardhii 1813]
MTPNNPYLQHLTSSDDLITDYQATRSGFVILALEKNRRATPFIEQARTLKLFASQAKMPADLVNITDIQPALLTAAGLSEKAIKYLEIQDKIEIWHQLETERLENAANLTNDQQIASICRWICHL